MTVTIPDLVLHILGRATPTAYPSASWTGLASGSKYVLCVDDPGGGTPPSFFAQAGSLPLASGSPAYRYVVYSGTFALTAPVFVPDAPPSDG